MDAEDTESLMIKFNWVGESDEENNDNEAEEINT